MKRNILTVGAYERDNFGDYLFFEIIKRLFQEDNILPGSVVGADLSDPYGIITIPYDYVLSKYKVDVVWVVGGELGPVDVVGAGRMFIPDNIIGEGSGESLLNDKSIANIQSLVGANTKNAYAYIPDLSLYPRNATTPLVVNSVGLSFSDKTKERVRVLQQAKYISVRDSASMTWAGKNINLEIAPDLVHILPKVYKPKKLVNIGIAFQANESFIKSVGVEHIAEELLNISKNHNMPVNIFAAGTAKHHDSPEQLKKIVDILKAKGIEAHFQDTRKPLEIVDIISSSSITIATSLHARIVACAYSVPRVSLENKKVSNYVKEWDKTMPYDIGIDNLAQEVNFACSSDRKQQAEIATNLMKLSQGNIDKIIKIMPKNSNGKLIEVKKIQNDFENISKTKALTQMAEVSRELQGAQKNNEIKDETINRLNQDLSYQKNEITQLAGEIKNIKSSKAYRYIEKYRSVRHRITRR